MGSDMIISVRVEDPILGGVSNMHFPGTDEREALRYLDSVRARGLSAELLVTRKPKS